MDSSMFDELGNALITLILAVIGIAFTLGVLATWLLPKLWHWIKPIIHNITN